ncbi:hypothetical protein CcaCcLH18_05670 [Colletotrichum camelliae]|nr:hypothetical protein CcaCcLH18_05670 [Colletotrichum camelliae]
MYWAKILDDLDAQLEPSRRVQDAEVESASASDPESHRMHRNMPPSSKDPSLFIKFASIDRRRWTVEKDLWLLLEMTSSSWTNELVPGQEDQQCGNKVAEEDF